MKKIILIIILTLIIGAILFFGVAYFLNLNSKNGALQITSSPESKVYLEGELIGQTPLCKCEATDMLKPGNYTVRLVPNDKNLSEFQEKVTISSGVLTVVDRKFAKDSMSEGSVISLSPLSDKEKTELLVVSLPEGATILLDSNEIGKTPFSYKDPTVSDHVLTVKKIGYKEKTIRIRTPMGYKLTVAAYLSTLDSLNATEEASVSATIPLTPSPTIAQKSVLILDTPTGFLRVRDRISGVEIARVTPGERYELISEQKGWFQIKLKNGDAGWIASQFAQKN